MSATPATLLVLNPNRSAWMTAQVAAALRARLPSLALDEATAEDGPAVIDSADSFAAGGAAAAAQLARELATRPNTASVLLACFGDPGLEALRALAAPRPVWGMAECALQAAARLHGTCAVITCGPAWAPLLLQRAADFGLAHALQGVWALPINGAQLAAEPARWRGALQAAVDEAVAAGARSIVFGGAVFAGVALGLRMPVPVIDTLDAVAAATAAAWPQG